MNHSVVWISSVIAIAIVCNIALEIWKASIRKSDFHFISSPLASERDVTKSSRKLVDHSASQFSTPEVIKVTDRVYVAIGFAIANSIMIVGSDGIIIVDTTESREAMREILTEFRKITKKPTKAVIVTHFHSDHHEGTSVIINEAEKMDPTARVDIYAHELTKRRIAELSEQYDITVRRATRQFGIRLPTNTDARTGCGIGIILRLTSNAKLDTVEPTVTFNERGSYNVAGVNFELIHTPGETDDQITVHLPRDHVIMPGDNIYKTFPNLYAIRGSPTRSAKTWYQSLDKARSLNAEYLVPSHTRPVLGKEAVYDTLLVYRDAIKYVHDQTVRLLNKGMLPDDIVKRVKLPDRIATHPYLFQHYGTVEWSVRGIFTHYLGWFSGDAVDLQPMHPAERAERILDLVTHASESEVEGVEALLQKAQMSLEKSHKNYLTNGEHSLVDDKWALELADVALRLSGVGSKFEQIAKTIRVSALTSLGVESISANGRNYYLTVAAETRDSLDLERTRDSRAFVLKKYSISRVLEMFCLKVKGLKCQHVNRSVILNFTDTETKYGLTLRNGVCDVISEPDHDFRSSPSMSFTTTSKTWRLIMAGEKELKSDDVKENIAQSFNTFNDFLSCFDSMV